MSTSEVWRYADMCHHWGVSRTTVERWIRLYESTGQGIPVHRDPSGRPYWLAREAAGDGVLAGADGRDGSHLDERVERLRRAARRPRRAS